ncbi:MULTISPECIES: helix-turn-helix domain-containing protein [unclassified Proteus (in: enterobacteria)]|uniref:helix-turn-helix domain-containing protein n=1 Tax=unclassified Proteus (in: enterobacteria) TaxID=257482 RepID=UPI0013773D46|nr:MULTISPECIES: helix-turn-helix transcriptional regulator [unclassified Proteus (in: enterobacteria)]NBM11040.1 helix-turn-helix domain-containing protein [Proteus sp. G2670]NBM31863.1 helix-turn-helix domain-containing protein [Proteus sp. G2664]
MVISNLKIKDTIETITAEIIESVTLLEKVYGECEDEMTSATISCVIRSTKSSLRKADDLVVSLLSPRSLKGDFIQKPKTPAVETTSTKNAFAERLKLVLRESGITQTELAKCMGVSQSLISSLVTGKRHGIEYSTAISNALGINKWWLAYGEGEMTDFCTSKTEGL